MSDFLRACALGDLDEESAIHVEIGDVPVCLVKTQGEVFAMYDECSHAEVPLSEGDVEDGTVECWLHGSRFDVRSGKPTGLPATEPVDTFPIRVDGNEVFVAVKES